MLPRAPITNVPNSAVAGIRWPALPSPKAAQHLALLQQLEQSQWWPARVLRAWQMRQIAVLLGHAVKSVPFYGERLRAAGIETGKPLTAAAWARIPILTRAEVQGAGAALHSTSLPKSHGAAAPVSSSGSTGRPVTVLKTQLDQVNWNTVTIRNHLWHGRDFSKKLAAIRSLGPGRARYPKGTHNASWGAPVALVYPTGPSVLLNVETGIANQVDWLRREAPAYLLTLPTNVLDLATHCIAEGIKLPGLRDVATLGGSLQPRAREACRKAWGISVVDMYSAQEVGYIALQCPEHEHYHVQAETMLVEVLGDDGRPCAAGETGRVVVTPLHNFAMPLIRYEIGDYAELGGPCPCGRGLPVLRRILGRVRNMMILPTGQRTSPGFINDWFTDLPVAQFQVVQRAVDLLEFKIVPHRPFTDAEEDQVRAFVRERAGAHLRVAFAYVDEIPRGPGGKFEDFKCEIDGA